MIQLRDYQEFAKQEIRKKFREKKRVLLIGATGFGKTETVASMIQDSVKNGKRVVFLADRIVLIEQTSRRLWDSGIRHGVIQGENSYGRHEQVLVCSQQTIEARGWLDSADLIIIDEAHTIRKKSTQMILAADKYTIGLTASPFSAGLNEIYQATVTGASTKLLQDRGWLVPCKFFLATPIDETRLKMANGEYTATSAADAAEPIIGDIITDWVEGCNREFGQTAKTLVYVPTVDFGADLSHQFKKSGYDFRQVSYRNTPAENQSAISALIKGECDGLISVDALVKGLDIPDVQCLVIARKYSSSLTNHIQLLGRGMRACKEISKSYCLVNDHVGNVLRFASEAEPFWLSGEWDLSQNANKKDKKKRDRKERETKERKCKSCGYVVDPGDKICPSCGAEMPTRKPVNISVAPGKMEEYVPGLIQVYERKPNINLWAVLSTIAINRKGVNDIEGAEKFAKAMHKNLTGRWPVWGSELDFEGDYDATVDKLVNNQIRKFIRNQRKERGNHERPRY